MKTQFPEYAQYLTAHFTKADIVSFGDVLGLSLPRSLKKSLMAERLALYLAQRMPECMRHLPERDLRLLRYLVHQAPGEHIVEESAGYSSLVELMGIVRMLSRDDGSCELWLPEEFFAEVGAWVDQALEEGEQSRRFHFERLTLGYLNLYGVMPFGELMDHMRGYLTTRDESDYLAFLNFILLTPLFKVYADGDVDKGEHYIVSPEVYDFREILSGWELYRDIPHARAFTYEELIEAGSGAPDFTFRLDTPTGQRFREMLLRIGYVPEAVRMIAHDVWLCSQVYTEHVMDDIYGPVSDRMDAISSYAAYDHCLEIMTEYVNSLPRWQLRGWSPEEKGYMKLAYHIDGSEEEQAGSAADDYPQWQMPRPSISEGYTDLIEKDEGISRLLSLMPNGFPFGMAIPHVSQNDPCPCGSGLKYGHCHGKTMN